MIKINVNEQTKSMLARFGPNKLFGDDIDSRKALPNPQAIALFDKIWNGKLLNYIWRADVCPSQDAHDRLTAKQQAFFDFDQEHRSFRPQELGAEFIVQLRNVSDSEMELTQLWRVLSSDTHPKTVFVTFDTVEEREQFRKPAQNLGMNDETLGLELCRDFMRKHPAIFLTDRM